MHPVGTTPIFAFYSPPKKMLMFPYNGKTVYLDAA